MDSIIEVLKMFIPGSVEFLMLGLAIGLVMLYGGRRARERGRRWLTYLLFGYVLLAIPSVGLNLEGALARGYADPIRIEEVGDVDAILILGGGAVAIRAEGGTIRGLSEASALRVLEGARLYHALGDPWVVASGGPGESWGAKEPESRALSDALQSLGVPAERILLESESRNTMEQAENMSALFQQRGIRRFLLVTSPPHMRRAVAVFEHAGLDPIPAPAPKHSEGASQDIASYVPSSYGLQVSRMALRESFALGYYWVRGWLASP